MCPARSKCCWMWCRQPVLRIDRHRHQDQRGRRNGAGGGAWLDPAGDLLRRVAGLCDGQAWRACGRGAQAHRADERHHDPGDALRAGDDSARHLWADRWPGRQLRLFEAAAVRQFRAGAVCGLRDPHCGGLQQPVARTWAQPVEVFPRCRAWHAGGVRQFVELCGNAGGDAFDYPQPGVSKDYAAFAVPLGASIKMDGCGAIFPALCAVFIAQYTGVP